MPYFYTGNPAILWSQQRNTDRTLGSIGAIAKFGGQVLSKYVEAAGAEGNLDRQMEELSVESGMGYPEQERRAVESSTTPEDAFNQGAGVLVPPPSGVQPRREPDSGPRPSAWSTWGGRLSEVARFAAAPLGVKTKSRLRKEADLSRFAAAVRARQAELKREADRISASQNLINSRENPAEAMRQLAPTTFGPGGEAPLDPTTFPGAQKKPPTSEVGLAYGAYDDPEGPASQAWTDWKNYKRGLESLGAGSDVKYPPAHIIRMQQATLYTEAAAPKLWDMHLREQGIQPTGEPPPKDFVDSVQIQFLQMLSYRPDASLQELMGVIQGKGGGDPTNPRRLYQGGAPTAPAAGGDGMRPIQPDGARVPYGYSSE